jgi:hypothetical protein
MPILALLAAAAFDLPSRTIVARFHAEGAQVYECRGSAWTFREPVATLIEDGRTVGRHFAGPRWQLDDGSLVTGHLAQSIPGATAADIAVLKLDIVLNAGTGRLAQATVAYRLDTRGGTLQGPCDTPGALRAVAYAADYVFAR